MFEKNDFFLLFLLLNLLEEFYLVVILELEDIFFGFCLKNGSVLDQDILSVIFVIYFRNLIKKSVDFLIVHRLNELLIEILDSKFCKCFHQCNISEECKFRVQEVQNFLQKLINEIRVRINESV